MAYNVQETVRVSGAYATANTTKSTYAAALEYLYTQAKSDLTSANIDYCILSIQNEKGITVKVEPVKPLIITP